MGNRYIERYSLVHYFAIFTKVQNYDDGFMPGKSTTYALFALRVLMEKYREVQKELHCVCGPGESLR